MIHITWSLFEVQFEATLGSISFWTVTQSLQFSNIWIADICISVQQHQKVWKTSEKIKVHDPKLLRATNHIKNIFKKVDVSLSKSTINTPFH